MLQWSKGFICPYGNTPEWNNRPGQIHEYYEIKQRFAAKIKPCSVVEFGVLQGQGALALCSCSETRSYLGFDNEHEAHYREKDFTRWARHLFEKYKPRCEFRVDILDTNTLASVPTADLYHIDGDHTYEGTTHDLMVAFASMGPHSVILVDDLEINETLYAVSDFLKAHTSVLTFIGEAGLAIILPSSLRLTVVWETIDLDRASHVIGRLATRGKDE